MKRYIFAVDPASRDAAEDALGALLGEGWGKGCLVPYPQPARPDQGRPVATSYVCDVHLDDDQAAKVEQLAAAEASITLARAKATGERDAVELKAGDSPDAVPVEKQRASLARVLAAHAAKEEIKAEEAEEVAWIR